MATEAFDIEKALNEDGAKRKLDSLKITKEKLKIAEEILTEFSQDASAFKETCTEIEALEISIKQAKNKKEFDENLKKIIPLIKKIMLSSDRNKSLLEQAKDIIKKRNKEKEAAVREKPSQSSSYTEGKEDAEEEEMAALPTSTTGAKTVDPYNSKEVTSVIRRIEELAKKEGPLKEHYAVMAQKTRDHYEVLRKSKGKGKNKPSEQEKTRAETYLKQVLSMPGIGIRKDKSEGFFKYLTVEDVRERLEAAKKVIEEADLSGTEEITKAFLEQYARVLRTMLVSNKKFGSVTRGDTITDEHMKHVATMPYFCIDGPPGTGKTTIAKAIATALGMGFYAQEMAAKQEDHIIAGRGVEWAAPELGIIARAQATSQSSRVAVLLDEAEKAGSGVLNALTTPLEVTAASASDKLLETEVDKRGIMFILTTNNYAALPEHIRSRVQYLYLGAYSNKQKIEILKKIAKQEFESVSLTPPNNDVIAYIVENYITEPGIREAKALINKLVAKASALNIEQLSIENVENILGPPKKYSGKMREAWTKVVQLKKEMSDIGRKVDEKGGIVLITEEDIKELQGNIITCNEIKDKLIAEHQNIMSALTEELNELTRKKISANPMELRLIEEDFDRVRKNIANQETDILEAEKSASDISNKAGLLILNSKKALNQKESEELLNLFLASPDLKLYIERCKELIDSLRKNKTEGLEARIIKLEKVLSLRISVSELLNETASALEESQKKQAQNHIRQVLDILKETPLHLSGGLTTDLHKLLERLRKYPKLWSEKEDAAIVAELNQIEAEKVKEKTKILDTSPPLESLAEPKPKEKEAPTDTPAHLTDIPGRTAPAKKPEILSLSKPSSSVLSFSGSRRTSPSLEQISSDPGNPKTFSPDSSRSSTTQKPSVRTTSGGLFFQSRVAAEIATHPHVSLSVESPKPLTQELFKEITDELRSQIDERRQRAEKEPEQHLEDTESFKGLSVFSTADSAKVLRNGHEILEVTYKGKVVEITASEAVPKDDEMYAMVLAAKIAAEKCGRKRFIIEHCEDNPAAAFKLYLIGKSMGLTPTFKDALPHLKEATLKGIIESEYGKTELFAGSSPKTIAEIFKELESGKSHDPNELKKYIAELERDDHYTPKFK